MSIVNFNTEEITLLKDETINLDNKDLLGTRVYSDTLHGLISNKEDSNPVTIGLFGTWGSGKSSIIDTLTKRLENEDGIITMTYDAWKYSNDAFRRSFIIQLVDKLELEFKETDLRIYHDISEESSYKLGVNKTGLLNYIIFSPFLFLLIWFTGQSSDLKLTFTMISAVSSAILALLKELFIQYKTTISKPKFFSPEQFEEIFDEIVNESTKNNDNIIKKWIATLTSKRKTKKLVIIIDNIDRCDKATATELLLTVKNFLEKENCIFIIPVDDEALKRHLNFDKNYEGEEFLRKIFNVFLRIKKFNSKDLFEYTSNLIAENNLGFSAEIADIISHEFSRNPRRIIQFLNNLTIEREVAKRQEENGLIPSGSVTSNIRFLAKLLILKEEWPSLYDSINNNPAILTEINKHIISEQYKFENLNYILINSYGSSNIILTEEQFLYFKKTITIEEKNIELFLRIQDFNRDMPDNLKELIFSQNWSEIKKILNTNSFTPDKLFSVIIEELEISVNKYNLIETRGYNIINLILTITNENEYELLFEKHYQRISGIINDTRIKKILQKLNRDNLITFSKKLSEKNVLFLRDFIAEEITKDTTSNLIKSYVSYYIDDLESLSLIKEPFTQFITKDISNFEEYFQILKEKGQINVLINNDFFNKVISTLTLVDFNESTQSSSIKFLHHVNASEALSESNKNNYLAMLSAIIQDSVDIPLLKNVLHESLDYLNIKQETLEKNYTIYNNKIEYLYNNYFSLGYRNQDLITAIETSIKFMEVYYNNISSINHSSMDYILRFLTCGVQEFCLQAIISLDKIILAHDLFDYPFVEQLINQYKSTNELDQKEIIVNSLSNIIRKVESKDGKLIGVNESQANQIVDILFKSLFDNSQITIVENTIIEALNNNIVNNFFEQKISSITNQEQQKVLLKIIGHSKNQENIAMVVETILRLSDDYTKLQSAVDFIIEQISEGNKFIKESLLKLTGETSSQKDERFKSLIETSFSNLILFNKNDIGILIDRVLPLLVEENIEEQLFAITILGKLESENIPKKKSSKIIALIEDIRFEKEENELLLNALKAKIAS
ncbi:KAP family NTPase [Paenibacillus sp. WQ 127069]|uniref:KAP family NTPase n=1 Tax=Paenibacillus baimaensis TaxID=2982185 RepID=A0ABT2UKM1_9BACL|nr:KAP family NTPase [Paenibacillus sp. WQ 127069]MCU6795163.1 KAP family NTPase [Paenibacillus sp. WQ 127069]